MIQPVITEKSYSLANQGWYTFAVDRKLSKNQARKIIEDLYKVKVVKIKSLNKKTEIKRSIKTRKIIKKPSFKKIIVKLAKDQKIDLFGGLGK